LREIEIRFQFQLEQNKQERWKRQVGNRFILQGKLRGMLVRSV